MIITSCFRVGYTMLITMLLATGTSAQVVAPEMPVSDFVRRIHEDARGDLWLGTNGDGVLRRRNGRTEVYSIHDGFGGVAVRAIEEDAKGTIWFGTSGGVTIYDGETFRNFTEADGLVHRDVWALHIDDEGVVWVGTLGGACRFDGERFVPFEIPASKPDHTRGVTSDRVIHCITEDREGRLWFGNNAGAWVWDGTTLSNLSSKDGMCGDVVNSIIEGADGAMWFATHHNGVCRYEDGRFTSVTEADGVEGAEVWSLFLDSDGGIWFPVEGYGVYRFDGTSFTNFGEPSGLTSKAIQCVHEGRDGTIWLGGWTGLFRKDGDSFTHVMADGPWGDR